MNCHYQSVNEFLRANRQDCQDAANAHRLPDEVEDYEFWGERFTVATPGERSAGTPTEWYVDFLEQTIRDIVRESERAREYLHIAPPLPATPGDFDPFDIDPLNMEAFDE